MKAADLSDELQRRAVQLFVSCGLIGLPENFNASAHT
jgi:hypothetical protein